MRNPFQPSQPALLALLARLYYHIQLHVSRPPPPPQTRFEYFQTMRATFLTKSWSNTKEKKNLGAETSSENTTVNPTNVFPTPPYQHLATTPFPSNQHQLQYVWVPFLVPIISGVPPPPQSGLHGIPIAPPSAARQGTK